MIQNQETTDDNSSTHTVCQKNESFISCTLALSWSSPRFDRNRNINRSCSSTLRMNNPRRLSLHFLVCLVLHCVLWVPKVASFQVSSVQLTVPRANHRPVAFHSHTTTPNSVVPTSTSLYMARGVMGKPSNTASVVQATFLGMKKLWSVLATASALLIREFRGLTDSQKILMVGVFLTGVLAGKIQPFGNDSKIPWTFLRRILDRRLHSCRVVLFR